MRQVWHQRTEMRPHGRQSPLSGSETALPSVRPRSEADPGSGHKRQIWAASQVRLLRHCFSNAAVMRPQLRFSPARLLRLVPIQLLIHVMELVVGTATVRCIYWQTLHDV